MLTGGFQWFHNRSLRVKLITLFGVIVVLSQLITGLVASKFMERQLRSDLIESKQSAISQMATNINEMFVNIVEGLYPVLSMAQSFQVGDDGVVGKEYRYFLNNVRYQELYNNLLSSRNNYRYINSMLILEGSGDAYYFVSNGYSRLRQGDLFANVLREYGDRKQSYWTSPRSDSCYFGEHKEEIVSVISSVRIYKQVKCFVVLNVSVKRLEDYLASIGGQEVFLQTGENDWICSGVQCESVLEARKGDPALQNLSRKPVESLGEYLLISDRLIVNGWNLSLLYAYHGNSSQAGVLLGTLIPVLVCSGFFLLLSSSFIVTGITGPLRKLTEIMRDNGGGGINRRIPARYKDEVGALGNTYNQMMDDIRREQERNRTNYMKMLQLQIKPHFLYNSMESTRFLVEMKDDRAVDMIRAIVRYYKFTLSGVRDTVSIGEEIEHLSCYLQILQIRYTSRYDYTIELDEAIREDEICKFILQPLVENAVYHGVKLNRKKGVIRITGKSCPDGNILEIWDDGVGIPPQKLQDIHTSLRASTGLHHVEHIGIINVHERLQARYGMGYGLSIESEEGRYTRVTVKIPAIPYKSPLEEETNDQAAGD